MTAHKAILENTGTDVKMTAAAIELSLDVLGLSQDSGSRSESCIPIRRIHSCIVGENGLVAKQR